MRSTKRLHTVAMTVWRCFVLRTEENPLCYVTEITIYSAH